MVFMIFNCKILVPFTGPSFHSHTICYLSIQCMREGLVVAFQTQPQFSANPGQKNEVYAQVWNYCPFLLMNAYNNVILLRLSVVNYVNFQFSDNQEFSA